MYCKLIAIAAMALAPLMCSAQERLIDELRTEIRGAIMLQDDFPSIVGGMTGGGSSWLNSSTDANGATTIKGKNPKDGLFEIMEDAEGAITVKVTREYGVDDADELLESHPELYMYLKAIPKEIGDSQIVIKMDITTTYKGDTAEELKESNEDAFKLYEKYKKGSASGSPFAPPLRARVMPRLRFAPDSGGDRDIILRMGPDGSIEIESADNEEESDDDVESDDDPYESEKESDDDSDDDRDG